MFSTRLITSTTPKLWNSLAVVQPKFFPVVNNNFGSPAGFVVPYSNLLNRKSSLDKVVKLELLEKATNKEIEKIWLEHNKKKAVLSAVVPTGFYRKFRDRLKECPMFVFPLPKKNGYISFVMQKQDNHVLFTPLESWKQKGGAAAPAINVEYFEDFESRGIVLMLGDVVDQLCIQLNEAKTLLDEMTIYYDDDVKFDKFVRKFNKNSEEFDFNEVVEDIIGFIPTGEIIEDETPTEPIKVATNPPRK